jgi:hypothetical protein
MKERAFSNNLKQATDPHPTPKKSMHQGIDPAHPVTRSKTPPRLCASARDSPVPDGAAAPPFGQLPANLFLNRSATALSPPPLQGGRGAP